MSDEELRELDRFMAVEVMGWDYHPDRSTSYNGGVNCDYWYPSENLNHAMEGVEKWLESFRDEYSTVPLFEISIVDESLMWRCLIGYAHIIKVVDPSPALAICLALKEAKTNDYQ